MHRFSQCVKKLIEQHAQLLKKQKEGENMNMIHTFIVLCSNDDLWHALIDVEIGLRALLDELANDCTIHAKVVKASI